MKFVTYNIQYGTGRDGKVDLSRIIDEVTGADVIALQEVERFWPRTGNVDQVKHFTDHFSDYYTAYGPGVDMHIEGTPPSDSNRRQFGNMILSRYPLEYCRHHLLPKHGSIGPLSIQRSTIEASIKINQTLLRIYSVHLTHLSPATRLPQVAKLLDIHHSAVHQGYPIEGNLTGMDWESGVSNQTVSANAILFGDFNFQPDSEEYSHMVGPVCDYGGHITSTTGFVDAWSEVGHDKMQGFTSEANKKPARLDYGFVSSAIRQKIRKCWVDDQATGSDHFPVWLEMEL